MPEMQKQLHFFELVDLSDFKSLLRNLYQATGIPNGLVAEDGALILQEGWVDACANFHRVHPESELQCQASNIELMSQLQDGDIACAQCKNGLLDYATPVVIEGQRLATLFLGQVFNEPPDIEFFRLQARKFGYNETAYIEAILAAPIIPHKQIQAHMKYMVEMARMLAESGLARLRRNKLQIDLERTTEKRIELEDLLESSPVGIGWSNSDGTIEYINRRFIEIFGYTLSDIPDLQTWYRKAYRDRAYRQSVITDMGRDSSNDHSSLPELEVDITCKDGSKRHILLYAKWIGNKRLVNFTDITAHWKSEQRNRAHDAMLEMVAKNLPLSKILDAIVLSIEIEAPESFCSILLLDSEGLHLNQGASRSLPRFYNQAIDGIEIGMGAGSCGTAAFTGKRVIVEDIMAHDYWKPYRTLAQQAGLRACWSEPILSSENKVLGTFAIYHTVPSQPEPEDIERIHFAANLSAIAIENHNVRIELESRAYTDYLTGLFNRRAFIEKAEAEISRHNRYGSHFSLIMFDIDYFKKVNDSYGHNVGDRVLKSIGEICRTILREVDITGRVGGEEFAVVLPQTSLFKALEVAERLRTAIETTQFPVRSKGLILKCTASFGVAVDTEKGIDIDTLMLQSDKALYRAKSEGRNRVRAAEK